MSVEAFDPDDFRVIKVKKSWIIKEVFRLRQSFRYCDRELAGFYRSMLFDTNNERIFYAGHNCVLVPI